MTEYTVTWEIQVEADNPRQAAQLAREHQTREGTTAVVFDVCSEEGETTRVDLLEPEGPTIKEELFCASASELQRLWEGYDHGQYWVDHPRFTFKDWQQEVANGDTYVGFWDWVYACVQDEDD